MLRNGLQFRMFGSGPVTSAGVEAGAFVNPRDPEAPPSIQAFCVPIVYLDRDALDEIKDDYGVTITTVVVKPKSRGEVRLASDDPTAMALGVAQPAETSRRHARDDRRSAVFPQGVGRGSARETHIIHRDPEKR